MSLPTLGTFQALYGRFCASVSLWKTGIREPTRKSGCRICYRKLQNRGIFIAVVALNVLEEGFRFFIDSFKNHCDFLSRFNRVIPPINGKVRGENIGTGSKSTFHGATSDLFGHFGVRENRVDDATHFFDSESLKTRLPTDFFCP